MAVFHLLMILLNVVDPELMRTWRMRLWNCSIPLSETRRNACAVRSFVCSLVRFQTPSLSVNCSLTLRILGRMRSSKLDMEKRSWDELMVSDHSRSGEARRETYLRVVLGVDGNERVVPVDRRERTRKTVLDVPKDGATEVDIVLDETHAAVARPALLVVVTDQAARGPQVSTTPSERHSDESLLVVGIGIGAEVSLNEIARLVRREPEHDVNSVDVARVEADRVASLGGRVAELEEVVGDLRRTGHLACALETEDQDVEDETVVLRGEGGLAMRTVAQTMRALAWKMNDENWSPRIIPYALT